MSSRFLNDKPRWTKPRRNKGLTFIEMLVTLVIVAVLIALLVPGVQEMRKNAWKLKGVRNARTLVTAALRYASEHKGQLPQTYFPTDSADPRLHTKWMDLLAPYVYQTVRLDASGRLLLDGTFRCPGLGGYKAHGDRWALRSWNSVDWMNFLQSRPGGAGTPLMDINTRTVDNSKTAYIVSTDRNNGSAGLAEGKPSFDRYVPRDVWIYNNGVIVGYLDGHVEVVSQPSSTNIFKP